MRSGTGRPQRAQWVRAAPFHSARTSGIGRSQSQVAESEGGGWDVGPWMLGSLCTVVTFRGEGVDAPASEVCS
jgi:hypothetical protein